MNSPHLPLLAAVCSLPTLLVGAAPPPVVTADWLAGHREEVQILDVRDDYHGYFEGHVPGAIHAVHPQFRSSASGVPARFLDAEAAGKLFAHIGLQPDRPVVLYGSDERAATREGMLSAAMVAYCLERAGHQGGTALLSGGLDAYAAGHPLDQHFPEMPSGTPPNSPPAKPLGVSLEELLTLQEKPNVVVVDARPPAAYAGESKFWLRNGHIPGAINFDWHQLVQPDNWHLFRSESENKQALKAAGITPDKEIIVYCGTGREATLAWFYLSKVLGFPAVRLYEGSWTEYAMREDLPVAKGQAVGGTPEGE